jgi:hypothetical protein
MKPGRKPKENDQKPRKATETQGPCPSLRGFCIKALTVWCVTDVGIDLKPSANNVFVWF